jgi:hypothetical protein
MSPGVGTMPSPLAGPMTVDAPAEATSVEMKGLSLNLGEHNNSENAANGDNASNTAGNPAYKLPNGDAVISISTSNHQTMAISDPSETVSYVASGDGGGMGRNNANNGEGEGGIMEDAGKDGAADGEKQKRGFVNPMLAAMTGRQVQAGHAHGQHSCCDAHGNCSSKGKGKGKGQVL